MLKYALMATIGYTNCWNTAEADLPTLSDDQKEACLDKVNSGATRHTCASLDETACQESTAPTSPAVDNSQCCTWTAPVVACTTNLWLAAADISGCTCSGNVPTADGYCSGAATPVWETAVAAGYEKDATTNIVSVAATPAPAPVTPAPTDAPAPVTTKAPTTKAPTTKAPTTKAPTTTTTTTTKAPTTTTTTTKAPTTKAAATTAEETTKAPAAAAAMATTAIAAFALAF